MYLSKNSHELVKRLSSDDSFVDKFEKDLSKKEEKQVKLVAKIIMIEFGIDYENWDKLFNLVKLATFCHEDIKLPQ